MKISEPVVDSHTRDDVFEELLREFEAAAEAFDWYLRQPASRAESSVSRVVVQQMQQAVWIRYGNLCDYLHWRRETLRQL